MHGSDPYYETALEDNKQQDRHGPSSLGVNNPVGQTDVKGQLYQAVKRPQTQNLKHICVIKKYIVQGLPWWSSGSDSTHPMQGPWVRTLVGEQRSRTPHGTVKK